MTLATSALECAKMLAKTNAAGDTITALETEIKAEIGEAITFYNRQSFALTEFRGANLTTASGTVWYSSVDLTTGDGDQDTTGRTAVDVKDILQISYMRNETSSVYDYMKRLQYPEFEALFEGSNPNSQPSAFTVYAGQIGMWPTPDAAYTMYVSMHVKPVVPTADGDTSVWLDEAEELILSAAAKRMCLKYLRDTERAGEFAALEQDARRGLEREYLLKSSSGRLKVHA